MMKVFCVFDEKAQVFQSPFFARTVGEGLRIFEDAVLAEDSRFARHAADFSLHELGTFDEFSGALVGAALNNVEGAERVEKFVREQCAPRLLAGARDVLLQRDLEVSDNEGK